MVDRLPDFFMGMFTHSAHSGAPPMINTTYKYENTTKTAEFCEFYGLSLQFVNSFTYTIGYMRANAGKRTPEALFLLRSALSMLQVVLLPINSTLSYAACPCVRKNSRSEGY